MPDQTPRPDRRNADVNRVLAAAVHALPALRAVLAQAGNHGALTIEAIQRLHDATIGYQDSRTDTDAARDLFLSRFPDAQTMQDEVDRRAAGRQTP